jgi:hypothetical protein
MRSSRILAALFAALAVARGSFAQRPAASSLLKPVDRDSVLVRLADDSWGSARQPAPHVLIVPRWRILTSFEPAMPGVSSDIAFANALAPCGAELPRGMDRLDFALFHKPWAAHDSLARGRPLVVFSIAPRGGLGEPCGDRVIDQPVAAARGLEFVFAGSTTAFNPESVTLTLGGRVVPPVLAGRAPVVWVRDGDDVGTPTRQVRLYVLLDDLVPDQLGRFDAAFDVLTAAGARDRIVIPDSVMHHVWRQALQWRLDRVRGQIDAAAAFRLLAPRDSIARGAEKLLEAGDLIGAAQAMSLHLSSTSTGMRRFARSVVGTTLWLGGDTIGARVTLGPAVREEPCLAVSSQANRSLHDAVDRLRPTVSCNPASPLSTMKRGLLFPGGGQRALGRENRVAIVTTGLFATAVGLSLVSRYQYHKYQGAGSTVSALALYDDARNTRRVAAKVALAGGGLWLGAAIESAWAQSRANRQLKWISDYRGGPR